MQLTLSTTTLASLAMGTLAAPSSLLHRQGASNPRLAQFRVYGEPGCSELNDGFYTIDLNQDNTCSSLILDSKASGYQSVLLQESANSTAGICQLKLYSDVDCSDDETVAALNVCQSVTDSVDSPNWNSFRYECGGSANTTTTDATV